MRKLFKEIYGDSNSLIVTLSVKCITAHVIFKPLKSPYIPYHWKNPLYNIIFG
jgi:hypothetical protein